MKKNFKNGNYLVSTDKSKLNLKVIHNFLSNSYWAKGRTLAATKLTVRNSLCFGLYYKNSQIGFARIITDFVTFAYLADVFILEEYRGRRLSLWLMKVILNYSELKTIKRWLLATRDAHKLYKKFGFKNLAKPQNILEIKKN
jgi:GNAT superfamily N-acetyltransferase